MRKYPFFNKRSGYLNLKRYICRIWAVKKKGQRYTAIGANVWKYPCKPDQESFNADIILDDSDITCSGKFCHGSVAYIWTWQTEDVIGEPLREHLHIEDATDWRQ